MESAVVICSLNNLNSSEFGSSEVSFVFNKSVTAISPAIWPFVSSIDPANVIKSASSNTIPKLVVFPARSASF